MKSGTIKLIASLLVFAACCGGYWWWYADVSSLSATEAGLAGEIRAKTDNVSQVAAAKSTLSALTTEEATTENYFVPQDKVVDFLGGLQATGRSLGARVEITSVNANASTTPPVLSMALSISGPFTAVVRTLGVLEHGPQDLVVQNLTLGSGGTSAGDWTLSGTVSVGMRAPTSNSATSSTP